METKNKFRTLSILLWITQLFIGILFCMAGFMKLTAPIEVLQVKMTWVTQVPEYLVRFIGIAELLGGIGCILPSMLRIKPHLTIWAAIGLCLVMLLAAGFHLIKGEYQFIGLNLIFALFAGFIAWGRGVKVPINTKK